MESLRESILNIIACPNCKSSLRRSDDSFICENNHTFPLIRGIPRFVPNDGYVSSFSFEWNTHKTTQLDSHRGDTSSEDCFRKKTGLSPEDLKGKLVLDAGVGAGRFADVMTRWGANVIGIDLSFAVEAAAENLRNCDNAFIAQANIFNLPFRECTFDYIVSIGVLHHTPDTRRAFEALVPLLKPGGTICIWVYPAEGLYITRKEWIPFTSRIPARMYYEWCRWFVPIAIRNLNSNFIQWISSVFPFSNQSLGIENDILDTFDGFSPRYHGIHSVPEVKEWFISQGLVDVREPSSWTTSVRGMRP